MSNDQIFLSYSRQELYFAEAIVHQLKNNGLNIWFDLEQLEPGSRWFDEIKVGLEQSEALILISSQAALRSPWVAQEWQHALDHNKPVCVVLFEAVEFSSVEVIGKDGQPALLELDRLQADAAAIIDGRGNFNATIARLTSAIQGTTNTPFKDVIPQPNRLKLPTRMPITIAFIAFNLAALTLLTAYHSLTTFTVFLPIAVIGVITTGFLANQTWGFLHRTGYRTVRWTLLIAPVYTLFFAYWLTPLVIVAALLATRAPDVHRWSPLGEGIVRQRESQQQFVHRRGDGYVFMLSAMFVLAPIEPLIAGPGALITAFLASRATRRPSQQFVPSTQMNSPSGLTYWIVSAHQDVYIAEDIRNAMDYFGHRIMVHSMLSRRQKEQEKPDYVFIVATNTYIAAAQLDAIDPETTKTIVVVGCGLEMPEQYRRFSDYQWVDYRRQDIDRLFTMAQDLVAPSESIINSFSTRIVPQDFRRNFLPRRVAFYVLGQLVLFSLILASSSRSLSLAEQITVSDGLRLVVSGIIIFVSLWSINKIIRREIDVGTLVQVNVGLAVFNYIVAYVLALSEPIPPGFQWDISLWSLLYPVVLLTIGAFTFRAYMNIILRWWLPTDAIIHFPDLREDWRLWRRNVVIAVLVVALTITLGGRDISYAMPLTDAASTHYVHTAFAPNIQLGIPSQYAVIPTNMNDDDLGLYLHNVPIAAVLREASGPFNSDTASVLNAMARTELGGSLILSLLGPPIGNIFSNILSAFDTGRNGSSSSGGWRWQWIPWRYGAPSEQWVLFRPSEREGQELRLNVWNYWASPNIDNLVTEIETNNTNFLVNAESSQGSQTRDDYLIETNNSGVAGVQWISIFDTPNQDFYLTVSGDSDLLLSQQEIIEHIVASATFP